MGRKSSRGSQEILVIKLVGQNSGDTCDLATKTTENQPILSEEVRVAVEKGEITLEKFVQALDEITKKVPDQNAVALFNYLFDNLSKNDIKDENEEDLIRLFTKLKELRKNEQLKAILSQYYYSIVQKILQENDQAALRLLKIIREEIVELKNPSPSNNQSPETSSNKTDFKKIGTRAGLLIFAILGLLKGSVEGYNGINSLITVIPGLSGTPLALAFCIGFMCISVLIYYFFDYRNISHALGVPILQARGKIINYKKQTKELKAIYSAINKNVAQPEPITDSLREQCQHYANIANQHTAFLTTKKQMLEKALPNPLIKTGIQGIIFTLGGILYTCGGFFSGQAAFMSILGLPAIAPWIIALSIMTGSAFFVSYVVLEGSSASEFADFLLGISEKSLKEMNSNIEKITEKQTCIEKWFGKTVAQEEKHVTQNTDSQSVLTQSTENNERKIQVKIPQDGFSYTNGPIPISVYQQ